MLLKDTQADCLGDNCLGYRLCPMILFCILVVDNSCPETTDIPGGGGPYTNGD